MIESVRIVSVPVSDQERARSFYVDALGFELRQDVGWGDGMRWVEVATENSPTSLTLVTWFDSMPPGSLQGLVVTTSDIHRTHEELAARGVPFDFSPREMPGGTQAVFRDPDGNGLVLSPGWCSRKAARPPPPAELRFRHPAPRTRHAAAAGGSRNATARPRAWPGTSR